jgi:hypothetical protein
MPEDYGFEHVVEHGRAKLRCVECGETGEPWEFPLARRYQHHRMHLGLPTAVASETKLMRERTEQQEMAKVQRHRERRVIPPPRRCANPYCGKVFQPRRSTARFCSVRCRVAAHRAR